MKKIKVEVLTKEAFAPFGEVLTPEGRKDCGVPGSHTWFPDVVVREEPTCVNLIPFARPGKFTEDDIHVFYIPKGTGISCKPGVWHWAPYTLEESVMCTVIFKKNTSQEDIYFTELSEPVGFELS